MTYNTARVSYEVWKSKKKRAKLEGFSFRWYRIVSERKYEINNEGSSYDLRVTDVGCKVVTKISDPNDPRKYQIIRVGPVHLDPKMKTEIENVVIMGKGAFDC